MDRHDDHGRELIPFVALRPLTKEEVITTQLEVTSMSDDDLDGLVETMNHLTGEIIRIGANGDDRQAERLYSVAKIVADEKNRRLGQHGGSDGQSVDTGKNQATSVDPANNADDAAIAGG